jgi:hypothetical protein
MLAFETRIGMTLDEAGKCLRNFPADGIHYIVANEDGSFSIVGRKLSKSEKLADSFYDAVVVATSKKVRRKTRHSEFFDLLRQAAAKPIVLRELIQRLIATYRPPSSPKDPEMVIRLHTRAAYALGYLRQA